MVEKYHKLEQKMRSLALRGDFKEAQRRLSVALKREPNAGYLHWLAGELAVQQGHAEQAFHAYSTACQIAPSEPAWRASFGQLLLDNQQYSQAAQCFSACVSQSADHGGYWFGYAKAVSMMDKHAEADRAFERATQLEPTIPEYVEQYARSLQAQNQHSRAIELCESAIQRGVSSKELLHCLGVLQQETGESAKALASYRNAVELDPLHYESWLRMTEIDASTANQDLLKRLTSEKPAKTLVDSQRLLLISRCHEQLGDIDAEWETLLQSHAQFLRSGYSFSVSKTQVFDVLTRLPDTKKAFNFDIPEKLSTLEPVFIVGTPRSSSTLLENILLQSDRDYQSAEESTIFLYALVNQGMIDQKRLDDFSIGEAYLRTLSNAYMQMLRLDAPFTDKSLENIFLVDVILRVFPNARIIYCERKPMASAVSILKRNLPAFSWAHDIDSLLRYFDAVFMAADKWEQQFPDNFYRFSYERFISDPEKYSKQVYEFCGLEWSKDCLDLKQGRQGISKTASNMQIRKGVDASSVNREQGYEKFFEPFAQSFPWLKS